MLFLVMIAKRKLNNYFLIKLNFLEDIAFKAIDE